MTYLLAALMMVLQADAPRKGELPLQIPQGWDRTPQEGAVMIAPKDLAPGKLYTVVVPDLTRKLGSLKEVMAAAQATLADVGKFKPARDPVGTRNDAGWDYEVLIGTLEKDGATLFAQAVALRKGEEEGMILVIADSLATLEKYSDPFTAMVRTLGAPKAAPAVAGQVDLKYGPLEGWTSKALDGGVLLEMNRVGDDTRLLRILILPSQPLQGGLRKAFQEIWALQVAATIQTAIVPLPLVRRMKSGMAVAFDQDPRAKTKTGEALHGGLYVLARGSRCVPILGLYFGLGSTKELDLALDALFESAEIPGSGPDKVALLDPADLAGEWGTSSYSMANYVNSTTGAYVKDASIATSDYLKIDKDGTYRKLARAIKGGAQFRDDDTGKWTLDDTELILATKEKPLRYRVFGAGSDPKAGAFLVLSTYSNTDEVASFSIPRRTFSGTWYKRKD